MLQGVVLIGVVELVVRLQNILVIANLGRLGSDPVILQIIKPVLLIKIGRVLRRVPITRLILLVLDRRVTIHVGQAIPIRQVVVPLRLLQHVFLLSLQFVYRLRLQSVLPPLAAPSLLHLPTKILLLRHLLHLHVLQRVKFFTFEDAFGG